MKKYILSLILLTMSMIMSGCGSSSSNSSDITAPIIRLIGDTPQVMESGSNYTELGATTDDESEVKIDSSAVDTAVVGSYSVRYNASDDSGNKAIEVLRTVKVVDTKAPVLEVDANTTSMVISKSTQFPLSATVIDTSGLKSLVINNGVEDIVLDASNTNFTTTLALRAGQNDFNITAMDESNNTTSYAWSVYLGHTTAAGGSHSGALKNDKFYTWGRNNYGQAGLGFTSKLSDNSDSESNVTHPDVPTVIDTPNKLVALSFNQNYSLAIDENGDVYSWGYNRYGELGRGETLEVCGSYSCGLNIEKVSTLSNIILIEAGYSHVLALDANNTLWAWGTNKDGELGTGDVNDTVSEPVKVVFDSNESINIVQISAGSDFSCVLDDKGQVWAWGKNNYGQVGQGQVEEEDGSLTALTDDQLSPLKVTMPEGVKIVSIATGKGHVLALGEDGKVYGWGLNASSQIGYYGYQFKDTDLAWERYIYAPVTVVDSDDEINNAIVDVYANGNSSYITRKDTKIYPWGQYGDTTAEGDHEYNNLDFPEDKLPAITEVKDVSSGALHLVAVREDDTVFTWRWSYEGSLGGGESTTSIWFYNFPILPVFE